MTEREWITKKLNLGIKKKRPDICWFKLGDTFGGHKKPSDIIATINGETIFIEVKDSDKALTPNELLSAVKVTASGGKYFILRFYPDKRVTYLLYGSDAIDTYDNLDDFITWL